MINKIKWPTEFPVPVSFLCERNTLSISRDETHSRK